MNWKMVIAVFAVVGIAALVISSQTDLGFPSRDSGSAGDGFLSGLFSVFSTSKNSTGPFYVKMVAGRTSFLGQKYDLDKVPFVATGLIEGNVKVGNVNVVPIDVEVKIDVNGADGTFEYTQEGTVKYKGNAQLVTIGDSDYVSGTKPLTLEFEMVPFNFEIYTIKQSRITVPHVRGTIERFDLNNTVKSTEKLLGEQVTFSKFDGLLKLEGADIVMEGVTSSVKGSGATGGFTW